MSKKIKIFLLILFILILVQFNFLRNIYGIEITNNNNNNFVKFLYFNTENINTSVVAYNLDYRNDNIRLGDVFKLDIYHNSKLIQSYNKTFIFDEPKLFEKSIFDVGKLMNGEYTFNMTLYRNNSIILNSKVNKFYYNDIVSDLNFIVKGNTTEIIMNIDGVGEDMIVYLKIPKEVITNLNSKNKDNLIYSKQDFKIIKEDPLIAWNLEKVPTQLNYTINKKISSSEQDKFKISVSPNSNYNFIKIIIIILILLIIIVSLKPLKYGKKK